MVKPLKHSELKTGPGRRMNEFLQIKEIIDFARQLQDLQNL